MKNMVSGIQVLLFISLLASGSTAPMLSDLTISMAGARLFPDFSNRISVRAKLTTSVAPPSPKDFSLAIADTDLSQNGNSSMLNFTAPIVLSSDSLRALEANTNGVLQIEGTSVAAISSGVCPQVKYLCLKVSSTMICNDIRWYVSCDQATVDLTVTNVILSDDVIPPGGTVSTSVIIGVKMDPSSSLELRAWSIGYYLSYDSTLSADDIKLDETMLTMNGVISASTHIWQDHAFYLPFVQIPDKRYLCGPLHLLVKVDEGSGFGSVNETDENNNVFDYAFFFLKCPNDYLALLNVNSNPPGQPLSLAANSMTNLTLDLTMLNIASSDWQQGKENFILQLWLTNSNKYDQNTTAQSTLLSPTITFSPSDHTNLDALPAGSAMKFANIFIQLDLTDINSNMNYLMVFIIQPQIATNRDAILENNAYFIPIVITNSAQDPDTRVNTFTLAPTYVQTVPDSNSNITLSSMSLTGSVAWSSGFGSLDMVTTLAFSIPNDPLMRKVFALSVAIDGTVTFPDTFVLPTFFCGRATVTFSVGAKSAATENNVINNVISMSIWIACDGNDTLSLGDLTPTGSSVLWNGFSTTLKFTATIDCLNSSCSDVFTTLNQPSNLQLQFYFDDNDRLDSSTAETALTATPTWTMALGYESLTLIGSVSLQPSIGSCASWNKAYLGMRMSSSALTDSYLADNYKVAPVTLLCEVPADLNLTAITVNTGPILAVGQSLWFSVSVGMSGPSTLISDIIASRYVFAVNLYLSDDAFIDGLDDWLQVNQEAMCTTFLSNSSDGTFTALSMTQSNSVGLQVPSALMTKYCGKPAYIIAVIDYNGNQNGALLESNEDQNMAASSSFMINDTPPKPRRIILEKWLPYKRQVRQVIHQKLGPIVVPKPRNVIVEYESPRAVAVKEVTFQGVIRADPATYNATRSALTGEVRYVDKIDLTTFLPAHQIPAVELQEDPVAAVEHRVAQPEVVRYYHANPAPAPVATVERVVQPQYVRYFQDQAPAVTAQPVQTVTVTRSPSYVSAVQAQVAAPVRVQVVQNHDFDYGRNLVRDFQGRLVLP